MDIQCLMMCTVNVFLCLLIASIAGIAAADQQLIILHTNDMHSHFAEMDRDGNDCTATQSNANECFGGFARILQTYALTVFHLLIVYIPH